MTAPHEGIDCQTAPARPVLEVGRLTVSFPIDRGRFRPLQPADRLRAVDGVSLRIHEGQTLALVGESGSGKTTLGRAIALLQQPDSGSVRLWGEDLLSLRGRRRRVLRRRIQMIFQDPFASLDPRKRVGASVAEAIRVHQPGLSSAQATQRVAEVLSAVGLAGEASRRWPHEFSGGQRQRIAIARALAAGPALIVCDEPTSALDVSIQGSILNLLRDLQHDSGIAYLFISHDLSLVRWIAHDTAVMYAGSIVEHAATDAICSQPRHPYTQALLAAVPKLGEAAPGSDSVHDVSGAPSATVTGGLPRGGCRFRARCPLAAERCAHEVPALVEVAPNHRVACHFWRNTASQPDRGKRP